MQTLLSKQLWTIAVAALFFGLLFNWFFFGRSPGVAFPLFVMLFVASIFLMFKYFNIKFNKKTLWYFVPIIFFSGLVAVRASEFLLFWNVLLTFGLLLVFVQHTAGRSILNYQLPDYLKSGIVWPLKYLGNSFKIFVELFSVAKNTSNSQKSGQIIKGIILTIPIILFLTILLSSADVIFGKIVSQIITIKISPEFIARSWITIIIAFGVLGVLGYIFKNASAQNLLEPKFLSTDAKFGNIEVGIILGAINFLFAVFVFIQIKYLFAGHSAISQFGLTYAEYAHKGFGELTVLSIFCFALLFALDKYLIKKNIQHGKSFLFLGSLMIVFLLVIMASAFLRLSAYEQAYGFTLLRLLVQSFIIWLAVIFFALVYKIYKNLNEEKLLFFMFISVLVFFAVLNFLNFDSLIAKKNIQQFAKQNKLDTSYFRELSADAIPEILNLQNYGEFKNQNGQSLPVAASEMADYLKNKSQIKSWQEWNWAKSRIK